MLNTLILAVSLLTSSPEPKPKLLPIVDSDGVIIAAAVLIAPSMALTAGHAVGELPGQYPINPFSRGQGWHRFLRGRTACIV